MGMDRSTRPAFLLAGGAALVAAPYGLMFLDGDTLHPLIDEDGWVESTGAIALAGAGLLFLTAGIRPPRGLGPWPRPARVSLLMLGIMFLFGAGEEVSWGQRQVDAEGPRRLVEANAQGEWTAHNLAAIDGSVDVLFTLFILGFAIVLPLAAHRSPALMARARGLVPVFPAWIALLFIANEVAFRAVWWGMPEDWYDGIHPFTQSAHEIRESVASLLFALAALVVLRRGPSQGADPGAVSRSGRPGVPVRR
jgi:hypothetical protein